MIFHRIFFFSSRRKKKHTQKKNHREEKICREGRELTFKLSLCLFTFGSRFCPFTFALPFQVFSPGILFFFSKRKEKKNHREEKTCRKEKKNHREEKICKEGRELTFKLLLYPFIFGFCFCPLASTLSFQAFSFSQTEEEKNTKKRKS
jgi:hypothetical protein